MNRVDGEPYPIGPGAATPRLTDRGASRTNCARNSVVLLIERKGRHAHRVLDLDHRGRRNRVRARARRGAHDEWNIVRLINERRRADGKLGTGNQIPLLFDGRAAAPSESEASVSDGYVGKCAQ